MIGKFLIGFFAVLAVLAVIGWWMKKRNAGTQDSNPDKVLENVADLNDQFARVRRMGQDGN